MTVGRISVVVPAHDEAGVIVDALRRIAGGTDEDELELVVVANGCSDATAELARAAVPSATVIEIGVASKPAALNAGDALASAFPRFYVDADIPLDLAMLRSMATRLDTDSGVLAVAATPRHRYDAAGVSPVVRSFYRVWTRLPAAQHGLAGTGIIGLSAEGRARFGSWPDIVADDLYVDRLFSSSEKTRAADVQVDVVVARTVRALVRRRARVRNGSLQVQRSGHGSASGGNAGALPQLLRRSPALAAHLPAYLAVTLASRVLADTDRRRGRDRVWHRDDARADDAGVPA